MPMISLNALRCDRCGRAKGEWDSGIAGATTIQAPYTGPYICEGCKHRERHKPEGCGERSVTTTQSEVIRRVREVLGAQPSESLEPAAKRVMMEAEGRLTEIGRLKAHNQDLMKSLASCIKVIERYEQIKRVVHVGEQNA